MNSSYVLQTAYHVRCPNQPEHQVMLLGREDCDMRKPWFYICFECYEVTEVGKGKVEYDPTFERRPSDPLGPTER